MTERVVDLFEVVDIDDEDRNSLIRSLRMSDGALQAREKQGAVGKSSEMIVMGLIAHLVVHALALRDIAAGDGNTVPEFDGMNVQPG